MRPFVLLQPDGSATAIWSPTALTADCYPVTALPHTSALYRDYASGCAEKLAPFYAPGLGGNSWMQSPASLPPEVRAAAAALLTEQNSALDASPATQENLRRFAEGASAVVTGQQVALFGGPLLTLLKAATAIRLAAQASRAGHPHVPIFWLATEDHDLEEVSHATFLLGDQLQDLRLPAVSAHAARPVGNLPLGDAILPLLAQLQPCLGDTAIYSLLARLYHPRATFGSAFAGFLARVFSDHGLIVIDASSRPWHALAAPTLRFAIQHADALHAALLERSRALELAGYHAQVLVAESSSLLFLLEPDTGARVALKKSPGHDWSAGGKTFSTSQLLAILDAEPERISPNALLRPVLQDTLLPTSAYVGGPAEIAYFAQSQVLYQRILGRVTPILPRFSATLIEPRVARILQRHQLTLPDCFLPPQELQQRLAARRIPPLGKRSLASAGNALDQELHALAEWMRSQDPALGHAADVAASKMLYQMNRLRRLAARFQLERDRSLTLHASRLAAHLFPHGNLQERVLAGATFLARFPSLPTLLTQHPVDICHGHNAIYL